MRRWLAPVATRPVEGLPPFQGGAAGYIGYEFGRTLEAMPESRYDDLALPDVVFGLYDWVMAWDHAAGRAWLVSTGIPEAEPAPDSRAREARRDEALGYSEEAGHVHAQGLGRRGSQRRPRRHRTRSTSRASPTWMAFGPRSPATATPKPSAVYASTSPAGDIFQANISQRFEAPLTESAWSLYKRLRTRNPAPFAAFLDFPEVSVLSASPERFLRVAPDGWVETRPIKGTRPRGIGPEHDAHLGRELTESEKDQAENLMIVDLHAQRPVAGLPAWVTCVCRSCSRSSTTRPCTTSSRPLSGSSNRTKTRWRLLLAAFPGGSVTGAPKIRAMEIIAELEPSARGVYCGCIGYSSVTGALDTSIAIRTAVVRDGRVTVQRRRRHHVRLGSRRRNTARRSTKPVA